jgi:hypothetical protein
MLSPAIRPARKRATFTNGNAKARPLAGTPNHSPWLVPPNVPHVTITSSSNAKPSSSLQKDAPDGRRIERPEAGRVVAFPEVGGLHHRYVRQAA